MRIGLVSYRCENRNTQFNLRQIGLAMQRMAGKADLLCFGETFLQGFDALSWKYEEDRTIALERSSEEISRLKQWTVQYGISLITGYIEKEGDKLYYSCLVISNGEIIHNYRRISKGWKEYTKTDEHYCEGTEVKPFQLHGRDILLTLCGDLWEFPERFKTDCLLIWAVYVNYSAEEWENGTLEEYAAQAALAAEDVLMINPIDHDPANHGGSFRFQNGQITARIPFDQEEILVTEV